MESELAAPAAESLTRSSRNVHGQNSSSNTTGNSGLPHGPFAVYAKVLNLDALQLGTSGNGNKRCGASNCKLLTLFFGIAMLASSVMLVRSLKNERQAPWLVPWPWVPVHMPGPAELPHDDVDITDQQLAEAADPELPQEAAEPELPAVIAPMPTKPENPILDEPEKPLQPAITAIPTTQATENKSENGSEGEEENQAIVPNDKNWLLELASKNGTSPCDDAATAYAILSGFDSAQTADLRLATNRFHQLELVAYTENGTRRCSGGDFYEVDLSGAKWKSRPPIKDLGNGSYLISLRVDSRFAGTYTFNVTLLFANLHGMDISTEVWFKALNVVHIGIEFFDPYSETDASKSLLAKGQEHGQTDLQICRQEDFNVSVWNGRWTRANASDWCARNDKARYQCLDPDTQCEKPWCDGQVADLDSNGWVYSAHCAFHIFTQEEAWSCLKGRWIFWWGDSNHQDTARNLLNFILGRHEGNLWRTFTADYSNPGNESEVVKMTLLFNGHWEESGNNFGLYTMTNEPYRETLASYFLEPDGQPKSVKPDTVILNSGLHDGRMWFNLTLFAEAAKNTSRYWADIWTLMGPDVASRPKLLWRSTVTPAGISRDLPGNPQKMELFNLVLGGELMEAFGPEVLKVVDTYDMTFPWHYDNVYSDGGHYGRPTHQYFVDIMLAHALLNAICPV